MTTTEANEFFGAPAEDEVVESTHAHRSSFTAVPSIAQAPKKPKGAVRLVVQYHFNIPSEDLKAFGEAHGRQYPDGVDFGRALLKWITAEGRTPDVDILEQVAERISVEVAK